MKMKKSVVGVVSAAMLMVVAGIGFGIAQAAGTHTDMPVLNFEDQGALEQSISSSPNVEISLASGSHSERPVLSIESSSDVAQKREPIETGSIPVTVFEEPWMKDYGND
jgi:hypothetical protein